MSLHVGLMQIAKYAARGRYFTDSWSWLFGPYGFELTYGTSLHQTCSTLRASIASATSNSLSVSWLLLPYGGLPARASLYLNERTSVSSTLIETLIDMDWL